MTKRRDVEKAIRAYAREHDLEVTATEGGSHTKVEMGGRRTVIPRHAEVNKHTAENIYKQLGMKP